MCYQVNCPTAPQEVGLVALMVLRNTDGLVSFQIIEHQPHPVG